MASGRQRATDTVDELGVRTTRRTQEITSSFLIIDETGKTVRTAIRACGWCFAAVVLYWVVNVLAGRTTSLLVQVALNLLFDIRFAVMLGSTGAAVIWALAERRLRQRTIMRLHPRIKYLESILDAGRSTSNLTPKGETNPMDSDL